MSASKNYPPLPYPAIHCSRKEMWIETEEQNKPLKYVHLEISYELGHMARREDVRDALCGQIFDAIMESLEAATPDLGEHTNA